MPNSLASGTPAQPATIEFDELPYVSHPFPETQPAHLAAVATFYGLTPPDVRTARVLELGCASGGNLIPLAARFPKARFLGVDLSQKHVDLGSERIAELGLSNIEIRRGDLGDPALIEGQFDYIICHGVFSWVNRDVQDQIFRICQSALAPDGMAYISYNVLPGWQLRQIVRDIFQFGDDPDQSLTDRVARGRWMLEQLAQGSNQASTYGHLLRQEATQLAAQGDAYLMSEFLVPDNLPCYFHDFMARAKSHDLAFLSETRISASMLRGINPALDQQIRALSGPDPEMYEQYSDFLQGRQFRQTILVPAARKPAINRKPDAKRLTGLHFTTRLHRAEDQPEEGVRLVTPEGLGITTNDPAIVVAFDHMAQVFPETRSPRQLIQLLEQIDGLDRTNLSNRLMDGLARILMAGLGQASAHPVTTGSADAPRPEVWAIARLDARNGLDTTVNKSHAPVRMDAALRAVLPLFDGTRDRATLVRDVGAVLVDKADSLGLFSLSAENSAQIEELVARTLRDLQRMGLLEPSSA